MVCFREQSLLRICHKEKCLETLPYHHKKWLKRYKEDLEKFKQCIEINSQIIPLFLREPHTIFDNVKITNNLNDVSSHSEQKVGTLSEGLDKVNLTQHYHYSFCNYILSK